MRLPAGMMLLLWPSVDGFAQFTVHLSDQTNQAFDEYIQTAENGREWAGNSKTKSADIRIGPWNGKTPISVQDGLIHDWVASMEVAGATVEKALALFRDYDNYKKIFAPEVVESKLLGHDGDVWRPQLRLLRKNVVTVVFDTEYQVEYKPLDAGRWTIFSRSTRISEVKNGEDLPQGTGTGYLWRLNAYWLLAPRPNGVYLQCHSVSLSRDIPFALRWLVKPMVSGVPRDSLQSTLEAVRRGLQ
jgi:hypothetical protein